MPRASLMCFCPTATHCFPYVKKRIAVMYQHHTDLSPIEVAIDEMSKKVAEIKQLCSSSEVDMIRLQLKLQGSISVQVSLPSAVHTETNAHSYSQRNDMAPMSFLRWMLGHWHMPEPFWMMLAPRSIPTTKWSSWRRSSGSMWRRHTPF